MKAIVADIPTRWLEERRRSGADRFDEMWEGVLHIPPIINTIDHQELMMGVVIALHRGWAEPNGFEALQRCTVVLPKDRDRWEWNYRTPDAVLLTLSDGKQVDDRFISEPPPLVCIEIRSPDDESYEKLPFFAELGSREAWIIDRDTKRPEVFVLEGGQVRTQAVSADGWVRSLATGVRMKADNGKLRFQFPSGETVVVPA